jgi:hemoglobin
MSKGCAGRPVASRAPDGDRESVAKQPGEYGYEDTSFRTMGGEVEVRRLVDYFYDAMQTIPEASTIRNLHPPDLALSREKLTAFLTGWLGGPPRYNERFGVIRIPSAHAHLPIGVEERDAWLRCMQTAVDQMDVPDDFRAYFMREIARPAARCVNR